MRLLQAQRQSLPVDLNSNNQAHLFVLWSNKEGKHLYGLLNHPRSFKSPDEVKAKNQAVATHKGSDQVYNLTITGTKDFPSGVFEVGSGQTRSTCKAILPLADGQEMSLGDLVKELTKNGDEVTIYWLACTERV
jgi:hypothetical protein